MSNWINAYFQMNRNCSSNFLKDKLTEKVNLLVLIVPRFQNWPFLQESIYPARVIATSDRIWVRLTCQI